MHEAKSSRAKVDACIAGQGAAFFEWPFRAQATNAPHGCGLERHFSSMLWLQGGVARAAPFEHSAVPGQTRAALVEHSAASGQTRSGSKVELSES